MEDDPKNAVPDGAELKSAPPENPDDMPQSSAQTQTGPDLLDPTGPEVKSESGGQTPEPAQASAKPEERNRLEAEGQSRSAFFDPGQAMDAGFYWCSLAEELGRLRRSSSISASFPERGLVVLETLDYRLAGLSLSRFSPDEVMVCDLCRHEDGRQRDNAFGVPTHLDDLAASKKREDCRALIIHLGKLAGSVMDLEDLGLADMSMPEGLELLVLTSSQWDPKAAASLPPGLHIRDCDDMPILTDVCAAVAELDLLQVETALKSQLDAGRWKDARIGVEKDDAGIVLDCLERDPENWRKNFLWYVEHPDESYVPEEWREFVRQISDNEHPANSTCLFLLTRFQDIPISDFEALHAVLSPRIAPAAGPDEPPPAVALTNAVFNNCRVRTFRAVQRDGKDRDGKLCVYLDKDSWLDFIGASLRAQMPIVVRQLEAAIIEYGAPLCMSDTKLRAGFAELLAKRMADDGVLADITKSALVLEKVLFVSDRANGGVGAQVLFLQTFSDEIRKVRFFADSDETKNSVGVWLCRVLLDICNRKHLRMDSWRLLWSLVTHGAFSPSEKFLGAVLKATRTRLRMMYELLRLSAPSQARSAEILAALGRLNEDSDEEVFDEPADWALVDIFVDQWLGPPDKSLNGTERQGAKREQTAGARRLPESPRQLPERLAQDVRKTLAGFVARNLVLRSEENLFLLAQAVGDCFPGATASDPANGLSVLNDRRVSGWNRLIGIGQDGISGELKKLFLDQGRFDRDPVVAAAYGEGQALLALAMAHRHGEDNEILASSPEVLEVLSRRVAGRRVSSAVRDYLAVLIEDMSWASEQLADIRADDDMIARLNTDRVRLKARMQTISERRGALRQLDRLLRTGNSKAQAEPAVN